jgi:diguanylate cyclase (GGDEF)-like protein
MASQHTSEDFSASNRIRQQRVRLRQARLVLFIDLALVAIAWVGVWLGLFGWREVLAWSAFALTGAVAFILAIASGFNLRFTSEPSLTLPQAILGVVSSVFAYLVTGPVRGATLLSVVLAIIFGMFALAPRQVFRLCGIALGLLGAEMLLAATLAPDRYPPRIEAMHFLIMALMLPAVGVLTVQLSTMRKKMRDQRVALEEALAKNYELASHDDLTGLRNRRSILEAIEIETRRSRRDGTFLTFAILDIDFFKHVNDTYGHGGGDQVLKSFAAVLTETLRETDFVSRWGGEEFLVVLPATTGAIAHTVIERLRVKLRETPFDCAAAKVFVAFSGGIAQFDPAESSQQAIERADRALYEAKNSGRNRTVG